MTDRQSLRFKDRATGVDVTLVGTMHYNQVSIELASSTVTRLREADALHAVVLESCPSRWKKTQKTQPPGSFLRWFLYNEMLAAADAAGDAELWVSGFPHFKSVMSDTLPSGDTSDNRTNQ